MKVLCTILLLFFMMEETRGTIGIENIVKKDVQLRMLKVAPELSNSWYEVDEPEFLLVRISPNTSKDLDSESKYRRFRRSPGLFSSW